MKSFLKAFVEHSKEFRIFYFLPVMAMRGKLAEEDISLILNGSGDEYRQVRAALLELMMLVTLIVEANSQTFWARLRYFR